MGQIESMSYLLLLLSSIKSYYSIFIPQEGGLGTIRGPLEASFLFFFPFFPRKVSFLKGFLKEKGSPLNWFLRNWPQRGFQIIITRQIWAPFFLGYLLEV